MSDLNEFMLLLQTQLDEAALKGVKGNLNQLQKEFEELKLKPVIDQQALLNIVKQLESITGKKITISNINVDAGQAVKDAQQTGQKIGNAVSQGVSSGLKNIKNEIASVIKSIPRLDFRQIISELNLNRASVGTDTVNQIRLLISEINNLGREVAKTGSDGSWDKLISKGVELGKLLDTFGKKRDITALESVKQLADYFKGKTISVGYKSSGLSGTDFTTSQLNKDLKELGVKFSATKQSAIELDTIWEEMCTTTGRMDLLNVTNAQDQLQTIINELQKAQSIINGEKGLVNFPNAHGVVSEYLDAIENRRKTIVNLENEMSTVMQEEAQSSTASTDKVIQNEERKQQAYRKTAEAQKQIAQEIRNATGDYEKAIKDVTSTSIGEYFKVDASTSAQFKAEMEKLVREWTNAKGKLTDIKIDTRTVFDSKAGENVEELRQAVVTYKNELNEVIKKTIAWRQIGTTTNDKGEEVALRGFVEVAGQYSKSLDTATAKTDTFIEKQQKAVASAQNTLSTIESKLNDPNINKSLAGTDFNANGLNEQLEQVKIAISALDNASKNTFTQAQIDVNREITTLKNLITTLKNAEYAATSLRTKGLDTTKEVYASKLDVLVAKMKSSGIYSNGFQNGAENLKNILNNATDTSGLTAFLNGLDKLEAGYKRAEASAKAFNQAQKVGIDVSGLQSQIADLQRISPEIDKFETEINGAKVTVQSLYDDLLKVNTQSDFSVIQKKWNAFEKAVKAAGIAVTEVGTNVKSMQAKVEKSTNSLFASFKKGFSFLSYWTSAHYVFMRVVRGIKEVIGNVRELDDALTNIAYTMDISGRQLKQIGESSLQAAKDLHTSVSKVLDSVKTYANAQETAESIIEKSKPTIMMSNVTGMDTSQTVDILQGVMEQFDLAEDKLMHISDVMQTVSMSMPYDFANGVKELSEGIQASGSVAKDAGYDLENYTALLGTLIAKTRQSGGELGRSLRTMFVRTTKASTSALANGEVTEDDLSNAEKALRRVGIEVRSDIDTFKSFDQIMGELYEKVDSLSDVDLSNIAYEVASTRQTNVFKMMIKAYGDYQEMAEKAYNADNVTLINQEKYAESLTGKLGELSAIWEKMGDDAISSDFLKGLADAGIGISSLIEKAGLLKTAMGIGLAGIFGKGRSNDFAL